MLVITLTHDDYTVLKTDTGQEIVIKLVSVRGSNRVRMGIIAPREKVAVERHQGEVPKKYVS